MGQIKQKVALLQCWVSKREKFPKNPGNVKCIPTRCGWGRHVHPSLPSCGAGSGGLCSLGHPEQGQAAKGRSQMGAGKGKAPQPRKPSRHRGWLILAWPGLQLDFFAGSALCCGVCGARQTTAGQMVLDRTLVGPAVVTASPQLVGAPTGDRAELRPSGLGSAPAVRPDLPLGGGQRRGGRHLLPLHPHSPTDFG